MSSTARSEALFQHDDLPLPVEIRGIRGAKRLRLRLDEKRGVLKLTGPFRMSRKAALEWAAKQREWVEAQVDAMLPPEPFVPGATIPIEGRDVRLEWSATAPRAPKLEGDQLVCGGPGEGFGRRVESFLKRRALDTLSSETADAAPIGPVSIRGLEEPVAVYRLA